jgi:hypothetical protein
MFCACDDDSNPTSSVSNDDRLIGNWSLTKISVTSLSMELTPEQAKFMMTIDVKNDGTFSMTTTDSTGTLTEAGEWSTADNTIKISYENGVTDELPYNVISANEITVTSPIEMQGMQIVADLTFRKE